MNKNSWLDNSIKESMACDESQIPLNYAGLEKAKQRLKNQNMMTVRIDMHSLFKRKTIRFSMVFVLVFILLGGAMGAGAVTLLRTDKIDYPFVNDPQLIGKWESVDFVKTADQFEPGEKSWRGSLFLREFAFIKNGKVLLSIDEGNRALTESSFTWTKGMVIDMNEKTAGKYEIRHIDGATYMFYEWKSGDYIFRGRQPSLYVLKKVDSKDYSNYEIVKKADNIDYPFVHDPQVIGKWKSVDFVKTIDKFVPREKSWIMALFLTEINFNEEGKLSASTESGNFCGEITWTKGLVLNAIDQTASAYVIKKIDGATYMFFEWKSGDYTLRGMEPHYYVLKKE